MARASIVSGVGGRTVGISFYCPGCESPHTVPVHGGPDTKEGRGWEWNASLNKPTLKPSVRISKTLQDDGSIFQHACHFHLIDGQIRYENDCSHTLNGRVLDLIEVGTWPERN